MAPVLWLLLSLVCVALGAPSSAPVMQLSALEPSADDPYDDEITIIAEPFVPFLQGYSDSSNVPNLRAGLTQQTSSNYFWPYWPSNTNGLLSNKLNLGSFLQNLPSHSLSANTVNGATNYVSNFWNRWQQFLNLAQQNAAQWQAYLQNTKGDQYYQYGLPSHPILYQLSHPYGSSSGYYKSMSQPEEDSFAPAYQVLAVMPIYNSPPIKVADMLRQRSLNYEKPQSDERPSGGEVVESNIEKTVEKEVKKNLKDDLKEVAVFDEKELKSFASGVAKEVASVVAVAAKNPGKVTEVMVRVDAKTEDDDDSSSSSSSSSSSEEEDHAANKKKGNKKDDDSDSDSDSSESSDSSDSSESSETSTTAPIKPTTQKQKTPQKHVSEESGQSSEESDEKESVEKKAKQVTGSRPVKAELVRPTSTAAKH